MLIRTELVGREAELHALSGILADALRGQPRLVLCEGEPGIGKTRLAEELLARARAGGAVGAWGSGLDSTGAPPYWPWRQLLRAVADSVDLGAIARARGLSAELARIAPDVFTAAEPGVDGPATVEDRFRQFDAVARLLRYGCDQAPLAIVLDDAHWADAPSLLLLQHVARWLTGERLLLVVNSRDTERQQRPLLTELLREPVSRHLHLRALSGPAVRQQLAMLTGAEPDEAQVDHVRAVTGGNPFFVTEMGRLLAEGAGDRRPLVTPTVRDAIAARLDRLPEDCSRLLQAAAVLGTEFSVGLAATMAGLAVDRALGLLDEAATASLVDGARFSPDRRFVHALVRDAIEVGWPRPTRFVSIAPRRTPSSSRRERPAARSCSTWPGTGLPLRSWAMRLVPPDGSNGPASRRWASGATRKRPGCSGRRCKSGAGCWRTRRGAVSCSAPPRRRTWPPISGARSTPAWRPLTWPDTRAGPTCWPRRPSRWTRERRRGSTS